MLIETFYIKRDDLFQAQWVQEDLPAYDNLQADEVLLRIDMYSFTANNISYITTGDKLGYWKFFPAQQPEWGKVPVWGFATVVASAHPEVQVGKQYYGYYPMASHLLVKAGEVKGYGFFDVTPHRVTLPAVYNQYLLTETDALYDVRTEAFQSVFRPLFTTSFLLDEFLASSSYFNASQIVLTSASSKTALALAFLLQRRKINQQVDYKVIGLTSNTNKAFVEATNAYDVCLDYNNLYKLSKEKTVVVDFAGNQTLHYDLQMQMGNHLAYNCLVGAVHWDKTKFDKPLLNKGEFFFAPMYAKKYIETKGIGQFQQFLGLAWNDFVIACEKWVTIDITQDKTLLLETYQTLVKGQYPANKAFVFENK